LVSRSEAPRRDIDRKTRNATNPSKDNENNGIRRFAGEN
jgi:hypothetical protein